MLLAGRQWNFLQRRYLSAARFPKQPKEPTYFPAYDLRGVETANSSHAFVVRSTSFDPYINLSIENYLLTHSPPDSRVYFFYVNRPCVVVGRNQNPWLETNLRAFQARGESPAVELVRRRSGGGTVFHDYGNLNYCAIINPSLFTRDLHAQVLADSLDNNGLLGTSRDFRVNERHDVVFGRGGIDAKVSGSAYKLVKNRALHHGTCLIASDLENMHDYLRSPARSYITAKGVESTRSIVKNALLRDYVVSDRKYPYTSMFNIMSLVITNFLARAAASIPGSLMPMTYHETNGHIQLNQFDPQFKSLYAIKTEKTWDPEPQEVIDEIESGASELRTSSWKFLQTPRFTFSSHPDRSLSKKPQQNSTSTQPLKQAPFSKSSAITLHVKSGVIESSEVSCVLPDVSLSGRALHEIEDWRHLVKDDERVATWLNETLCVPATVREMCEGT